MTETTKRILVGITQDDELYFLDITTERDGKPYFSMCGDTNKPITLEEIEDRNESYLEDEGEEFWKQAVASGNTYDSLHNWLKQAKNKMDIVDCSIFDSEVEVDGQTYRFEAMSCGQHRLEVSDIKHFFIPRNTFRRLIMAWDKYHMKEVSTHELVLPMPYNDVSLEYTLSHIEPQNIEGLAMQAITIINS